MNIRFLATGILCLSLIASTAFPAKAQQDALLNAIKNNSAAGVQQALMDVVKQGKDGKSPEGILLKAIMTGTTDEIKKAVQPVIEQGKFDKSPLTWAVLLKKPNAVEALLECGSMIDSTIVQFALNMHDIQTMLLVVKSKADISGFTDDYIEFGLRSIYQKCAQELVLELIKRGNNVNEIMRLAWKKSMMGCKPIAEFLIKNGANPDYVDTFDVPIRATVEYGSDGSMFIPQTKGTRTALTYLAASSNDDDQAVKFLLDSGADMNLAANLCPNCPDKSLRGPHTPLYFAINRGKTKIVALLLERGANIE